MPPPCACRSIVGVQHALAEELKQALARYAASRRRGPRARRGDSGEVLAAVSLPEVDPTAPADWLDPALADRLPAGTFELGSIFKTLTVAMALEAGSADLDKVYDVRQPLPSAPTPSRTCTRRAGRSPCARSSCTPPTSAPACWRWRPGAERQRAFLARLGLTEPMRTEAGPVAAPLLPKHWGGIETVTIGYGHGLARGAAAVRGRRRRPRQRRRQGHADLPGPVRRRRRAPARRLGGHQRQAARDHAPQRDEPARHRPARRGRGLPRRRQDRHGRDAGPRRLPGEGRDLLLRRRLPDGRAALRACW